MSRTTFAICVLLFGLLVLTIHRASSWKDVPVKAVAPHSLTVADATPFVPSGGDEAGLNYVWPAGLRIARAEAIVEETSPGAAPDEVQGRFASLTLEAPENQIRTASIGSVASERTPPMLEVAARVDPPESPDSPRMTALRDKVRRALDIYRTRYLNTRDASPWAVIHSIVAYGVDTKIRQGGPAGDPVTAIGWLCFNRRTAGQNLFYRSGDAFGVRKGPGVQGHHGQFLAILAQSRLTEDYPIDVDGKRFSIADLIKHEQATCHAGTELSFKLISLAHYLDSDATWKNEYGEEWSIERLLQEEMAQPIRGATCGGTHRLFGFSYALRQRMKAGKPMTGQFRRAQIYMRDYHAYAFKLQNSDGSMSTEWFRGPGDQQDLNRRLRTTGHILEWLIISASDEQLREPRMVKALEYLTGVLIENSDRRWEIGPQGHALHALALYDARVFAEQPAKKKMVAIAQRKTRPAASDDDEGVCTEGSGRDGCESYDW